MRSVIRECGLTPQRKIRDLHLLLAGPWHMPLMEARYDPCVNTIEEVRRNWIAYLAIISGSSESPVVTRGIRILDKRIADGVAQLSDWVLRPITQSMENVDGLEAVQIARTIRTVCIGYACAASAYYESSELRSVVLKSFQKVNNCLYFSGQEATGNWWEWTIGIPQALTDSYLMMASHLTSQEKLVYSNAVRHHIPDVEKNKWSRSAGNLRMSSANLVDQAQSRIAVAILERDEPALMEMISVCEAEMHTVHSGEGLYADGSYIFHEKVAYNGTYGVAAFRSFARIHGAVAATKFQMKVPAIQYLDHFVESALLPCFVNGQISDVVRGRALARPSGIGDSILALADIWRYARLRSGSSVQRWVQRCNHEFTYHSLDTMLSEVDESVTNLVPIMSYLSSETPIRLSMPAPIQSKLFNRMGRAIIRLSDDWTASLAIAKHDVAYFERGNGENANGYHTGSGMLLMQSSHSPTQFDPLFWRSLNPLETPGATVVRRDLGSEPGAPWGKASPPNRFGGGLEFEGQSVVGCDVHGFESGLIIRRSWFFAPDLAVSMGYVVETGNEDVQTNILNLPVAAGVLDACRVIGEDSTGASRSQRLLDATEMSLFQRLSMPGFGEVGVLGDCLRVDFQVSAPMNAESNPSQVVAGHINHGSDSGSAFGYYVSFRSDGNRPADLKAVQNTRDAQVLHLPGVETLVGSIFFAVQDLNLDGVGSISFDGPCIFALRIDGGRARLRVSNAGTSPVPVKVVLNLEDGFLVNRWIGTFDFKHEHDQAEQVFDC